MFALGESVRLVSASVGIAEMTAWTLQKKVRAEVGVIYCRCGKVAGHRGWCGFRIARSPNRIESYIGQLRDIATIQIIIPARPRYERPDIENERETEIRLLVNQRNAIPLDAPLFDTERSGHEMWGSNSLTPLEILLLKEEQESEDFRLRNKSIVEWERWRWRKASAFSNIT